MRGHMFRSRHKDAVRTDICRALSRLISGRIGKSASRMNFIPIFYTYIPLEPTPTCDFDFETGIPSLYYNQVKAQLYTQLYATVIL